MRLVIEFFIEGIWHFGPRDILSPPGLVTKKISTAVFTSFTNHIMNWPWPLLSILVLTFSSCANKVTWSEANREALLIDYGYHSSLVLQDAQGVYWEYTFGDWNWFAKNRSQWWRLPVTLFWPTTSTLARGEYPDKESLDQHLARFKTQKYTFQVKPTLADELVEKLNEKYNSVKESRGEVYQALYGLYFVALASESYHVFYNCNHAIVRWLERLDVQVSGIDIFSIWNLERKRD